MMRSMVFDDQSLNDSENEDDYLYKLTPNKSLKFESGSFTAANMVDDQSEIKNRRTSREKFRRRGSQMSRFNPATADQNMYFTSHTTYGSTKRGKKSKKKLQKVEPQSQSVPRTTLDRLANPFYFKLEGVTKKVREYVRLFGTKNNLAKMKRIRSKLRVKKRTFMDEVITGDSLKKIQQDLAQIEEKKQYERDLQGIIKESKLTERLTKLKSLQANEFFRQNGFHRKSMRKIRSKKKSVKKAQKRSSNDLPLTSGFKDQFLAPNLHGDFQSIIQCPAENIKEDNESDSEEESNGFKSEIDSSDSFGSSSQDFSQAMKSLGSAFKQPSGNLRVRLGKTGEKLMITVTDDEVHSTLKGTKPKAVKRKRSKSPLLKSNTNININSMLEELVNNNPFEGTDSLMTIDEVTNSPKAARRKNSNGFNLIIKKVEKEPEKINKIIFQELYKYYPNSRMQKRLKNFKTWKSRSPDKANVDGQCADAQPVKTFKKEKAQRSKHKFGQKDLTLEPPKQLKLKSLSTLLLKTVDKKNKSNPCSALLGPNMNHRHSTKLKERKPRNLYKSSSQGQINAESSKFIPENCQKILLKEDISQLKLNSTCKKSNKFPSVYRSTQSSVYSKSRREDLPKKSVRVSLPCTQKIAEKLSSFL
ncbi:unnamed protein product [Moneuplotes crassus]|uniref:Uncharacterized protein n=2 Tax=Euplotes crassus TaxID=5936 RepID=A0AAD1USV9_EUPCR|nr:unnamed protein product [Moneuplotes crassus]